MFKRGVAFNEIPPVSLINPLENHVWSYQNQHQQELQEQQVIPVSSW